MVLYSGLSASTSKSDGILDSVAKIHITKRYGDLLNNVKSMRNCLIRTANDHKICANKVGEVILPVSDSINVKVENTVYVPVLQVNVLSKSQIVKKNCSMIFNSTGC